MKNRVFVWKQLDSPVLVYPDTLTLRQISSDDDDDDDEGSQRSLQTLRLLFQLQFQLR